MRRGREKITKAEYERRMEKLLDEQALDPSISFSAGLSGYPDYMAELKELNPQNDWLFDDNEPEWMWKIKVSPRREAYIGLTTINDGLGRASRSFIQAALIIFGFEGMGILDVATWWISKRVFDRGSYAPLAIIATTNLSIMYLIHVATTKITEPNRQEEALVNQYRGKSMQYILQEAHTKGIIKDLDIPVTNSQHQ